jgi:hypothetical protein
MEHFNGVSSVPGTTGANRNSLHDALGNMTGSLLPMQQQQQQQQQQNNGKSKLECSMIYLPSILCRLMPSSSQHLQV